MKKALTLVAATLCLLAASAQHGGTAQRGQRVLSMLMTGATDSLYLEMSAEMQQAMTKTQLSVLWYTLEMTYGKVQSTGQWEEQHVMGYDVAKCRVGFARADLDFSVTFSGDEVAGMFFTPAPEAAPPQEPVTTTSFQEKHLVLSCDGYDMPALLTLPKQEAKAPCVIIVHGSGPNDKDGTIGGNKPYAQLARMLAERGVASFRYDKRTFVYRDLPDSIAATLTVDYETTDDAVAAAAMLHAMANDIDTSRLFVLGHSQGGMMIPRIAQRTTVPHGYIMMAAPARRLLDLMVMQLDYLHEHGLYPDWPKAREDMERQIANLRLWGQDAFDSTMPMPMGLPLSYLLDLEGYDQTREARAITKPLLVMNGEADYQVTMDDFHAWEKALQGKDNVTWKSYEGLNHIFIPAGDPSLPSDYAKQGTIPSEVADDIARFVKGL